MSPRLQSSLKPLRLRVATSHGRRARPPFRFRRLVCEPLEGRQLLDVGGLAGPEPALDSGDQWGENTSWGLLAAGEIRGVKWEDLDGDGERDPGEPGLVGWTIFLDENYNGLLDPGETTTTTLPDDPGTPEDEAGTYAFTGLSPGLYTVAESLPPAWRQTLPRLSPEIERLSEAPGGTQADGDSNEPSISADGRFVAFHSAASDLVPGDTNGVDDVFVCDRRTGTIERVSVASNGAQANGFSNAPSISADGRYVAFHSGASNLVPKDTNDAIDIFVYDRQTGTVERVSVDSGGWQALDSSYLPSISGDGRYVAFESYASDLVWRDRNHWCDVFVHDRQTGTVERVSVDSNGAEADNKSRDASISADGRWVAFRSRASNLVPGDTNGEYDVFLVDRLSGTIERVSVAGDGSQADGMSLTPSLSADGRYVAFHSAASNLVPGDTNAVWDVFVYDRDGSTIERVSVASDGTQANDHSGAPSISADGRYVAFHSKASNLVSGDTNGKSDVFVYDRHTATVQRVSVAADGTEADDASVYASITADGRYVAFGSAALNLVAGDTGGMDVFVTGTSAAGVPDVQSVVVRGEGSVAHADFGNEPLADFGDAPDPTYPTLLASDGARHLIVDPDFHLGSCVDREGDGRPGTSALGDDRGWSDDEDGVVFDTPLVPGSMAEVTVTASADGRLDAWLDFHGDGAWDEPGDRIFTSRQLSAGANPLTFAVPGDAPLGETYARFRFSSAGGLDATGLAADGEVEDYRVEITTGQSGVILSGRKVTAYGTNNDDVFEFSAGSTHTVVLNGQAHMFPAASVDAVVFLGGPGWDLAVLLGTDQYEEVKLWPGEARLDGTGYVAIVRDAESITVESNGGADAAVFYDEAATAETFEADATSATMRDDEFTNTANGFRWVHALSSGGYDTAVLGDHAATSDRFKAWPSEARMYNDTGFYTRVKGFAWVTGVSTGGNDAALLYDDPAGFETFTATPTWAEMEKTGVYRHRAEGFRYVHGFSSGGDDEAHLTDSATSDDQFKAWPSEAQLYNQTDFYIRAKGFREVTAVSTGVGKEVYGDVALIYDSDGDDTFVAGPDSPVGTVLFGTTSQGHQFAIHANGFRYVNALALYGGYDQATLYDRAGSRDTLKTRLEQGDTYLREWGRSPDFSNRAAYFEKVTAYATPTDLDAAKLYDSSGNDHFHADATDDPSKAAISSADQLVEVFDFPRVIASSVYGGNDTQTVVNELALDYLLTMIGDWTEVP